MRNKFLCLILCVTVLSFSFVCGAFAAGGFGERSRAEEIFNGIISYRLGSSAESDVQSWIDNSLAGDIGGSAEWYAIALSQVGEHSLSEYGTELSEYLSLNEVHSASSRAKFALALIAAGSSDAFIAEVLSDISGGSGIMSCIYSLHILNNGYENTEYTADKLVSDILSQRRADGGWSLSGEYSDVDVTAMAISALAARYSENAEVKTAVDEALSLLSEKQLASGDFSSYGIENPESTAQVIVALCSLGIDPSSDERFIKNGSTLFDVLMKYRLADGSFCHKSSGDTSAIATYQVFFAAAAYLRAAEGGGSIYILDAASPETLDGLPGEAPPQNEQGAEDSISYKPIASAAAVAVGLLISLLLFAMGKRNVKSYIAVLLAVISVIAFVWLTDISTPEDYYGKDTEKESAIGEVTLSIRCYDVLGELEGDHIPSDGCILNTVSFAIEEGDTVLDVLLEAARKYNIQIENNGVGELSYIAGINYVYEYDLGELSGWTYRVNGQSPSVGCGTYRLADGDEVEWIYTKDRQE